MTARGQQAVVLVNSSAHVLEVIADGVTGLGLHRNGTSLCCDDDVVFKENGSILGDRQQRTPGGCPCATVDGVSVAHRNDVWMRFVDGSVQHETGTVDGVITLNYFALVVGQDQVGHLDL